MLIFERQGDRTVQTYARAASPWHVFPPSALDDSGCAYVWLINPSGGLVGGDRLSIEATLETGTHVLITTPSATRLYRTLEKPVEQEVHMSVGRNARLEWLPDVTIPFAGSKLRQRLHVSLAEGATAFVWDAMAAGRVARDERWRFTEFQNEILLTTASGLSVLERSHIEPFRWCTQRSLTADWSYVASAFAIGDQVSPAIWRETGDALSEGLDRWPGLVLAGVSQPAAPGLAVKLVARSAPDLTEAMECLWRTVRQSLWRLPAVDLRRY